MDINNLWSGYDLNSKKQNTRCLAVNTILEGKYLVGPVLGQGGFGITYVGYDLNMEAKIAIKEYFPVELVSRDTTTMHGDRVLSLSGDKSVTYKNGLKKYVAEAQNVSQFSEIPGVVSVKDFFYANETAYIVMEYIDGISLKDYLKEKGGRLTEEETLKIMKPILEALVQVHKSGIIHRDISPDNIMLTFEDSKNHGKIKTVKLIDFGAARMTEKNDQKSLTIILKHGYAPEEQYRTHGEQGPWTDVYALCAVLYRMLTGETPVPAMDRMFQDELKSFEQCGAKVSTNTMNAILKGLSVKKNDRIQTVQELIAALYEGKQVKNCITKQKAKKARIYAVLGGTAAAALVGGFFLLSSGTKDEKAKLGQEIVVQGKADKGEIMDPAMELDISSEDETVEALVSYNPMRSASASPFGTHVLFCKPDGTVIARGSNKNGQCDVEEWDHVVAVEAGNGNSFGLRSDGTVLFAGDVYEENGHDQVTLWTDIVDIQTTRYGIAVGLKKDGTIVAAGPEDTTKGILEVTDGWQNVAAITCWGNSVFALIEDGQVLCSNELLTEEITGWTDVEAIGCGVGTVFGFCEDGSTRIAPVDREYWNYKNFNRDHLEKLDESLLFYEEEFGVTKDGTIFAEYEPEPKEIQNWSNLQAFVHVDKSIYYGLQKDGTLLEYYNFNRKDSPEQMKNLSWIQAVSIGHVSEYSMDNLLAMSKDGRVYTYGYKFGEFADQDSLLSYDGKLVWYNGHAALFEDGTALIETTPRGAFESFKGVKQVVEMTWNNWQGQEYEWTYVLLMEDGTVKRCQHIPAGTDPVEIEEITEYSNKYADVENWSGIEQLLGFGTWHVCGICEDGSAIYAGPEEYFYEKIEKLNAKGETFSQFLMSDRGSFLILKEDGTLDMSQIVSADVEIGLSVAENWESIASISLGDDHLAALLEDGTVKAAGSNHCGQCDVEEWTDVVYLTTGNNCTLGITSTGDLLMTGSLY